MQERGKDPFLALMGLLRGIYDAARADASGPLAATLEQILGGLGRVQAPPSALPPGHRLPACRHLDAALKAAAAGPHPEVAAAFAALEPSLQWMQNPNYTEGNADNAFLENYAYCDFLGPRGLVDCGDLAMGALLLGPGTLYADHAHPAVEAYFLLNGPADWRLDGGDWVERLAGSMIHHASGQVHAMRAGAAPLLLLYAWLGHLNTPASMTAL